MKAPEDKSQPSLPVTLPEKTRLEIRRKEQRSERLGPWPKSLLYPPITPQVSNKETKRGVPSPEEL